MWRTLTAANELESRAASGPRLSAAQVSHDEMPNTLASTDLELNTLLRKVARVGDGLMPLPKAGQIIGGKYRIEERLGRGGMGAVFRATHLLSEKAVALKWLLASTTDALARQRFMREARLACRICHPNVVNVYDVGEEGPCCYLVMELLHGESLRARIQRGRLDVHEVQQLLVPAMRAVAAIHRAGVIHRDLKPDNIFLCSAPDGAPRDAKVLDFGISTFSALVHDNPTLTEDGAVLGTPAYMPPEQLQSTRAVDHRADVYAFGVILYEALTGKPPFVADSYPALILAIAQQAPTPPRMHRGDIPETIERAVLRALSKRREDRFDSIDELMSAMQADQQCASGARSGKRRIRTPVRVLALAALAFVALAAGVSMRASSEAVATQLPSQPITLARAPLDVGNPEELAFLDESPSCRAASGPLKTIPTPVAVPPSTITKAPKYRPESPPRPKARVRTTADGQSGAAGSPAPAIDCNPPFSLDASGRTMFKLECFQR